MTTLEIKFEVLKQWGTITAGAKELECSRSQLSYCVHKKRKVPALRKKLADALGMSVEDLFGESRNPTGVSAVSPGLAKPTPGIHRRDAPTLQGL